MSFQIGNSRRQTIVKGQDLVKMVAWLSPRDAATETGY
jgi:hypothetical protein